MEPNRQSTTLELTPEGQIRVRYDRFTNGEQEGKEFVCEVSAAGWLAESIEKAANDDLSETEALMPPDHFRVYVGGGHGYDYINVNASNERHPNAIYGKLYVLSGVERDVARTLAEQLRAIQNGADSS